MLRAGALLILLALPPATAEAGFREDEVRAAAAQVGLGDLADRLAAASVPTVHLSPAKRGAEAAELSAAGGHLLVFTHVAFEYEGPRPGYGLWAGRCTTVLHVPAG